MLANFLRIGRLILSVVFVYAAWTKLRQPWEVFALSIDSYAVLSDSFRKARDEFGDDAQTPGPSR